MNIKLFTFLFLLCPGFVFVQEVYIANDEVINVLNINNCSQNSISIGSIEGARQDLLYDLAFHPNGKMYVVTTWDIVELDPRTWQPTVLQTWEENLLAQYVSMAINESGDFVIGGFNGHVYDLRSNRILSRYSGSEGFKLNALGYFEDKLYSRSLDRQVLTSMTLEDYNIPDTIWSFKESSYYLVFVTKTHKPCGGTLFVGQAFSEGSDEPLDHYLVFDEEERTIERVCYTSDGAVLRNRGLAATDDFRSNALLVDLDADNSSFHRTGGYYDTLTVCEESARLTDNDISFRLCGGTIDSIVFEMKYFDDPYLDREELVSDGDGLEARGPGRWVWTNTHGDDTDRISEFLQGIRYEADWPGQESHERIVVTTTWVDGEPTSSWTVLQLIGRDVMAGRDSTVSYCGTPELIDLSKYLSPGVGRYSGRFEPELSGGRNLFIPGDDEDRDYLYIVEEFGCRDTAVISVMGNTPGGLGDTVVSYCGGGIIDFTELYPGTSGRVEPALDGGGLVFDPGTDDAGTYRYITGEDECSDTAEVILEGGTMAPEIPRIRLCRGGSQRVGLPPGRYDTVEWWNGETGDSTVLDVSEAVDSFWVSVTSGSCTDTVTLDVGTILGEIEFPPWVEDSVYFCDGDNELLIRTSMDSLVVEGRVYLPGEPVVFERTGVHRLAGYKGSCAADKDILVEVGTDLGAEYSKVLEWCPGEELQVSLPDDNGLMASWDDGYMGLQREITSAGQYGFLIESDDCSYEGGYEIIQEEGCEECRVSIPNAVTVNGDGQNDGLEIFTSGCGAVRSVELYDKWGGLVAQNSGPGIREDRLWELPASVYLVQVQVENSLGKVVTEIGSVLLLR